MGNAENKSDPTFCRLPVVLGAILAAGSLFLDFSPSFTKVFGPFRNEIFALIVGLIAVVSLRFLRKEKSPLGYLIVCIPYLIVIFKFLLSIDLDGDSWRTHFPKFNYMCNAIANGHLFPPWFPSSGGIRIGYFHINLNQTLPHKLLGYLLSLTLPISTVVAYKLQYAFGVILMCFGWWLVLREITRSPYSAYFGTSMVIMGGTGITFHQEHVLATTYAIPWFILSLLKLRSNSAYIFPAIILFGLGLSTHYPQIQFISMGLAALSVVLLRAVKIEGVFREQIRFVPLLILLLILAALPALYVYDNSDILASEERKTYDTFRSRSYEDYLRIHQGTFSAAPKYYLQYLTPRWSKSPSEPYPIDVLDRCSFFVGRIGLILAAIGALLAFRRALPIFILLVVFIALSLGMYCPVPIPRYLFSIRFPFIDVFRQWVHFFPMVNFCLSALAALGLDRIICLCGHKSQRITGWAITLIILFQVADLAGYDKKYLSLYLEKAVPTDMLHDFYREITPESGVFQYKNRLKLYHSCAKEGIPTGAFITTDIINLNEEASQSIEKVCEILIRAENSAVVSIPPAVLSRYFAPGKQIIREEIPSYPEYDGLLIRTSLPGPALLIAPLNYDLRAEAYIDGEKTEIWRVNGAVSGVLASQGIHQIEFKISPDLYWPVVWIQWFLYIFVAAFFIRMHRQAVVGKER